MESLSGRDDNTIDFEVSIFGWALSQSDLCQLEDEAKTEKIGANFGMPHRNLPNEECHTQDRDSSALSVWVPLGVRN
jgi:hypothetical protein